MSRYDQDQTMKCHAILLAVLAAWAFACSGCGDSRIADYRRHNGPWNDHDSGVLASAVISDCVKQRIFASAGAGIAVVRDRGLGIDPQEGDALIRHLMRDIQALGYQLVAQDKAALIFDVRISPKSGPPPKFDYGYDVEVLVRFPRDQTRNFAITTEVSKRRG